MNARFIRHWVVIPVLLLASALLCAAAEVSAQLQREQVTMDDLVHLDISVTGRGLERAPEPPDIPGLRLLGSSSSRRIEMRNMDVSQVVVFSYRYAPEKVGTIEIPAIPLQVDGRTLHTNTLTLHVEAGGGGSRHGASSWQGRSRNPVRQQPSQAPATPPAPELDDDEGPVEDERMAYAEWVLPKKTGYVGEAILAELRLYVANSLRWNLTQYPTITGDGFMMQKLPEKPSSTVVTKDGQRWDMVTFKTAVTPVKSGTVTLEPAEFLPVVVLPQRMRRTVPRGFRDFFNDPFFDDAFNVNARKQISVKTEPLVLEVKPLPEEGKPASFAGAVGRFTLDVSADPLRVKGGDPVTLKMKIGGTGNFERVTAPQVAQGDGWRSYPPSSTFEGDDSIGISGEKTFEMALIPDGNAGVEKLSLPEVEFAFFDPVKEEYTVLRGERREIVVSGGERKPDAAPEASKASSVAAQPTPERAAEPEDIRFIRLDAGAWSVARGPLWKSPFFLGVQGVALLAFVGWCGLGWRRHRPAPGPEARWRQGRAVALKRARGAAQPAEFYDAAAEALTLHAALKTGREGLSQAEVLATFGEGEGEFANEIFATRDRLRYAGDAAAEGGRVELLRGKLAEITKG